MTSTPFSMFQIIEAKKRGKALDAEEIRWVVNGFVAKEIPDYQMAAWLMAIDCAGMDDKETAALTDAMLNSGSRLDFGTRDVVDKHSTGGIGDKASFILAPIAAACGVKVPMIAGRGLGHTGGTVDKIEAIPGFRTSLTLGEFENQLRLHGLVLMGQTPEIAPADRLVYSLRDVTATIDCIPLITASIMSKKLAEGAMGIVFDIKYGSGAFMRQKKDARLLAKSLLKTTKRFGRKGTVLLTDMSQPLGCEVGHSLEIQESIATLKGQGPSDLTKLSLELAAHMVCLAGKAPNLVAARKKCAATIENGSALAKFRELIELQGGNVSFIDHPQKLTVAPVKTVVRAPRSGWLKSFANDQIGYLLIELGGGRKTKEDKLDLTVGFTFHAKVGTRLKKDDPIMTIHHHPGQTVLAANLGQRFLKDIVALSPKAMRAPPLVSETLHS